MYISTITSVAYNYEEYNVLLEAIHFVTLALYADMGTLRSIACISLSELKSLGASILNVCCLYLVLANGTIMGPLFLTRGTFGLLIR